MSPIMVVIVVVVVPSSGSVSINDTVNKESSQSGVILSQTHSIHLLSNLLFSAT
jgi:hypothetical protein